jgi:DNA-binding transcriptional LysR family regulator
MHATLAEHHRRYPEVNIHIVDGGHDRLFGALMAKSIDIAIMTRNSSRGTIGAYRYGANGSLSRFRTITRSVNARP